MKGLILTIVGIFIVLFLLSSYQQDKRLNAVMSKSIRCNEINLLEGDIMIVRQDTNGYYIQRATINNVKQFLDSTE